jgi:hypothetical protein
LHEHAKSDVDLAPLAEPDLDEAMRRYRLLSGPPGWLPMA